MPPVVIAAGIGAAAVVGGAIINKIGSNSTADAQQKAADLQYKSVQEQIIAAARQQAQAQAERRRITAQAVAAADRSPNEIAAVSSILQQKQKYISDSQALVEKQLATLDSLDPNIKESGNQILSLLKGTPSPFLDPMLAQRQQQKAEMQAKLARTMGPGWMTSSAGIEAMTRFDQETYNQTATIQFNALNQVGQIYSQGLTAKSGVMGQIGQVQGNVASEGRLADNTILNSENNIATRNINAVTGASSVAPVDFDAVNRATAGLAPAAANSTIGDITRGQGTSALGGQIAGIGSSLVGQGVGSYVMGSTLADLRNSPGTPSYAPMTVGGSLPTAGNTFGSTYPSLFRG